MLKVLRYLVLDVGQGRLHLPLKFEEIVFRGRDNKGLETIMSSILMKRVFRDCVPQAPDGAVLDA